MMIVTNVPFLLFESQHLFLRCVNAVFMLCLGGKRQNDGDEPRREISNHACIVNFSSEDELINQLLLKLLHE